MRLVRFMMELSGCLWEVLTSVSNVLLRIRLQTGNPLDAIRAGRDLVIKSISRQASH